MPEFITHSVKLLSFTPDAEKLIERAGRVCWKSEDKMGPDSSARFLKMLMGKNHLSVLEHASATFQITTDRAIANEIVRHRTGKFSQESTRYCNYDKKGIKFITPTELEKLSGETTFTPLDEWAGACLVAASAYESLLRKGCKPEIARAVLPLCLATDIVVTMDFRNWLHFLDLRTANAAHPDMRVVANLIHEELKLIAPNIFA
jgi:thymidylate synthase (FAD)